MLCNYIKLIKNLFGLMGWLCVIFFFWIVMLFLVFGDDNIKIVNVIDFMIFEIIL